MIDIQWDHVTATADELEEILTLQKNTLTEVDTVLVHLRSGNSNLQYDEVEHYIFEFEKSKLISLELIDALEKAVVIKRLLG